MEETTPSGAPEGLIIEAVEWLPSGGRSGLVRVRGRWEDVTPPPGLPVLLVDDGTTIHHFASLPDPRADRNPATWRGAYVVNADLYEEARDALAIEFPGGGRAPLVAPAGEPVALELVAEEPAGGEVIDRAVLAERRARRAEATVEAQAKISAEAMRAVESLELRANQLEDQLAAITRERDVLARQAEALTAPAEVEALRERLDQQEDLVRAMEAELAELRARPATGRDAERLREALTAAVVTIADLRASLREAHLARRTYDIERTSGAVRLSVAEAERSTLAQQLAVARDEVRVAHAAAADAHRLARGAEAAHDETRRRFTERVAELEQARARIAGLEADVARTRESAERDARTAAEASFAAREAALAERTAELERAAAAGEAALAERTADLERAATARDAEQDRAAEELAKHETQLKADLAAQVAARQAELQASFDAREAELTERLDALGAELADRRSAIDTQLAGERSAWATAEAALAGRLEAAEAALAGALTARDIAEAAAAAADAQRHATSVASASFAGGEPDANELQRVRRILVAERAQREAAVNALAFERSKLSEVTAELDSERARIELLEEQLAVALASAEADAPASGDETDAPATPERALRLVGDVPAVPPELVAAADPLTPSRARVVADLDRAAAQLRERADTEAAEPEPAAEPVRREIISARTQPPRDVAIGAGGREYPRLRGALVKLAHDDPAAAATIILGLARAQWRCLSRPLDYDLTIGDGPTYRLEVTVGTATITEIPAPRARGESDFYLHADAVTLAEMLAGVVKFKRFGGPRVPWGKRAARALNAIGRSDLSLFDVLRDGARIDPAIALRCLEYAVPLSWTRGHDFIIEEHVVGPESEEILYITASDGRGVSVSPLQPTREPDAVVVISHAAFEAMLRGDAPPAGDRPAVRGDHDAVDTLRVWADRVRSGVE